MAVKVEYSRDDAERMLGAFEEQIASLQGFNTGSDYKVGSPSADRYAKFGSRSGEIYTLSIVVKTRLDKLAGGPDKALGARFDKAMVEAQKTIIKAGLNFMAVLSKMELLP